MASDTTPLASLQLTHVSYNPDDPLSLLSAFLALVPQALMVSYATLIYSTRELEIGLMFAGQMLSEAANWILKRAIKEERPPQMNGRGYGMPSSHAQFVMFFATYLSLFLLARHAPTSNTPSPTPFAHRALICIIGFVGAGAVTASRVYLRYHTEKQVLVGAGFGVLLGIAWYLTVGFLRTTGWTDWALELWPLKALRIRDLVIVEDLPDAGWVRWRELMKLKK
jgi:dolichyldiphosphatase